MRPFWKYYGGKWRLAPTYGKPRGDVIIEPFAGSAGYSVRFNAPRVILIDSDPVVVAVWRYLIGASAIEINALPDIAVNTTVDDYGLCQEAAWFVGFWMNSGVPTPRKSPSAWVRSEKRRKGSWGPVVRSRIASQLQDIRHWDVAHGPYTSAPDIAATWFVDPPYQGRRGAAYRHGSKNLDYEALALWCRSRKGNAIVCEAEGAKWLPFSAHRVAKTARSKPCPEVVWASKMGGE